MTSDTYTIPEIDILRLELIQLRQQNLQHELTALNVRHTALVAEDKAYIAKLFADWGVTPDEQASGEFELNMAAKELRRAPAPAVPARIDPSKAHAIPQPVNGALIEQEHAAAV